MKIILAYSGGLDTSVLVHWYANEQNAKVITYCADVGQEEELEGLEDKALSTGATAHRTLNLIDEFASDYIYPMVRGNAVYESQYLLGTSIARPLIAKAHIDIAREFGANAVAHGATDSLYISLFSGLVGSNQGSSKIPASYEICQRLRSIEYGFDALASTSIL